MFVDSLYELNMDRCTHLPWGWNNALVRGVLAARCFNWAILGYCFPLQYVCAPVWDVLGAVLYLVSVLLYGCTIRELTWIQFLVDIGLYWSLLFSCWFSCALKSETWYHHLVLPYSRNNRNQIINKLHPWPKLYKPTTHSYSYQHRHELPQSCLGSYEASLLPWYPNFCVEEPKYVFQATSGASSVAPEAL